MRNDWRSWRTHGSWLNDGQKRTLDDIGAAILVLLFVGLYIWAHQS